VIRDKETTMNGALYGMALVDGMKRMRAAMDGAITTGITPEPDGRTAPAAPADASRPRGTLLARLAARSPSRRLARPKAANCPTC
jgi:hypothetical protein